MAYEVPGLVASFIAGADLSAKQFYFMKVSADDTVTVCAAATDIPIGILQNAPTSGQAASVMLFGISKVSSDADLALGNVIGTSADGQADAKTAGTDTTEYAVGIVINDASAAAGLSVVAFSCLTPNRAA